MALHLGRQQCARFASAAKNMNFFQFRSWVVSRQTRRSQTTGRATGSYVALRCAPAVSREACVVHCKQRTLFDCGNALTTCSNGKRIWLISALLKGG